MAAARARTRTFGALQAAGAALVASREEVARLRGLLVRARQDLALLRAEDAELLAYARATVAAARAGDPDPVAILAGLLEERGQLPSDGTSPAALLAQGYRTGQAGGER
ncbi:hypothetical protein SAMN04489712_1572 [Thermomonospora echinospora]|uniref:Uncharacterized protein n=1 Tax=Thermomonospora echinospora TaxID=1992 RepID=A0A1H6EB47_9ACTN|nr:hypothetical protein [Thermomonospora echinospora]SEG94977.1 hypothetical protein SAMN04489712_1572 [Thermomonospora echinospora]